MSQRSIDFNRGEQLALLRGLELPKIVKTSKGDAVSAATVKAVLRAIDDHAGEKRECFATQETIAREVGVKSPRTIKRAIAALSKLNLITTERKRHINHHRIVWNELRLRQWRKDRASEGDIAATEGDFISTEGDTVSTEGDIGVPKKRSSKSRDETLIESPGGDGDLGTLDDEKIKALELAERIVKATRIPIRGRRDNQDELVKIALLHCRGQLCDADIQDAIAAVRKKRPANPASYFHTCIDNALGGGELNRLLANVKLGESAK